MKLTADYHTHTVYSHGKGTIMENAVAAAAQDLRAIGITDHGFSHPAYGVNPEKLPEMKALCREASERTGVTVLLGVEANFISTDGKVDLPERYYDALDLYLAGVHKFVGYDGRSVFNFLLPNLFYAGLKLKPPKSLVARTTRAYIKAIEKNPIDVITHVGFCCFCDPVEVAKCARDYGTYIELNGKKPHLSDEELARVTDTGVSFVLDSDAHAPGRVGDVSIVYEQLKRVPVPEERIANVGGRTPSFRFAEYKKRR